MVEIGRGKVCTNAANPFSFMHIFSYLAFSKDFILKMTSLEERRSFPKNIYIYKELF